MLSRIQQIVIDNFVFYLWHSLRKQFISTCLAHQATPMNRMYLVSTNQLVILLRLYSKYIMSVVSGSRIHSEIACRYKKGFQTTVPRSQCSW